jgi:hypothetical protein
MANTCLGYSTQLGWLCDSVKRGAGYIGNAYMRVIFACVAGYTAKSVGLLRLEEQSHAGGSCTSRC